MKTMTRPQSTAHAEHELTQLADTFSGLAPPPHHPFGPYPPIVMGASRLVDHSLIGVAGGTGIGVSWGTLKKRCTAQPSLPAAAEPSTTLGFVEVATPTTWPVPTPGTEIELQRRDGARLRIHSSRGAPPPGHPAADLFGDPLMLQLTPQSRIFLATEPVDFRKGIDGLAGRLSPRARRQSPQRRASTSFATAPAPP